VNNNYVIYDLSTGDVTRLLKTDNPLIVELNTPAGCGHVIVDVQNIEEVKKVDIKTGKVERKITDMSKIIHK
jgi:hypothetical protein